MFFDIIKIRRLVEDATDLAVRAANGTTSSVLGSSMNASSGILGGGSAAALGLGHGGNVPTAKLSRERKHRMRDLATQKLSRAYHLDEIASSVATMQGASSLEEVAKFVLQRKPNDCDARYVHFFHEKIPSRMLAQSTGLQALDEIIRDKPAGGEPLRTRAITRLFKDDFQGAVHDLTEALAVCRYTTAQHKGGRGQLELGNALGGAEKKNSGSWDRQNEIKIEEADQPSSFEAQLLFHRAGVYLALACQSIHAALQQTTKTVTPDASPGQIDNEPLKLQHEARKFVRVNAKRALRDYISFVSHFEYTPGISAEVTGDFLQQVNNIASSLNKTKGGLSASRLFDMPHGSTQENNDMPAAVIQHHKPSNTRNPEPGLPCPTVYPSLPLPEIYKASALFSASVPPGLPPYPAISTAIVTHETAVRQQGHNSKSGQNYALGDHHEAVTYHPLLTDALHSMLLCHALIQTPPKELLRHAHMVARLARVCDGYPIFLAARSPSRADWIEVMQRADNWLGLQQSWESLCAPAPLPGQNNVARNSVDKEDLDESRRQEAIVEALADDRVHDEVSFQTAVNAHERRAEGLRRGNTSPNSHSPKRWAQEDGKEYPVTSERAEAIAKWVKEAPLVSVDPTKMKRGAKNRSANNDAGCSGGRVGSFSRLTMDIPKPHDQHTGHDEASSHMVTRA